MPKKDRPKKDRPKKDRPKKEDIAATKFVLTIETDDGVLFETKTVIGEIVPFINEFFDGLRGPDQTPISFIVGSLAKAAMDFHIQGETQITNGRHDNETADQQESLLTLRERLIRELAR